MDLCFMLSGSQWKQKGPAAAPQPLHGAKAMMCSLNPREAGPVSAQLQRCPVLTQGDVLGADEVEAVRGREHPAPADEAPAAEPNVPAVPEQHLREGRGRTRHQGGARLLHTRSAAGPTLCKEHGWWERLTSTPSTGGVKTVIK